MNAIVGTGATALTVLLIVSAAAQSAHQPVDLGERFEAAPALSLNLELERNIDGYRVEFGRIGALLADSGGRIYVADVHKLSQEIVVLDEGGSVVDRWGGTGDGPGEFRALAPTLAWSAGGVLALNSYGGRHTLTVFEVDGAIRETMPWGTGSGGFAVAIRFLNGGEGTFAIEHIQEGQTGMLFFDRPADPPPSLQFRANYYQRSERGAWEPLTYLSEPLDRVGGTAIQATALCMARNRRAMTGVASPFTSRGPRRAFSAAGSLLRVDPDSLDVSQVDIRSGGVRPLASLNVDRVRLTTERWERIPEVVALRTLEEEWDGPLELMGSPGTPCPVYDLRPEFLPSVRTLLADTRGWTYAELSAVDGFELAAFDEQGVLRGRVSMPARDPRVTPYIQSERLYIATVDELGVQGVQVWRIEESADS